METQPSISSLSWKNFSLYGDCLHFSQSIRGKRYSICSHLSQRVHLFFFLSFRKMISSYLRRGGGTWVLRSFNLSSFCRSYSAPLFQAATVSVNQIATVSLCYHPGNLPNCSFSTQVTEIKHLFFFALNINLFPVVLIILFTEVILSTFSGVAQ